MRWASGARSTLINNAARRQAYARYREKPWWTGPLSSLGASAGHVVIPVSRSRREIYSKSRIGILQQIHSSVPILTAPHLRERVCLAIRLEQFFGLTEPPASVKVGPPSASFCFASRSNSGPSTIPSTKYQALFLQVNRAPISEGATPLSHKRLQTK